MHGKVRWVTPILDVTMPSQLQHRFEGQGPPGDVSYTTDVLVIVTGLCHSSVI